jgi:DnaJ-domain-containing protein 1
MQLPGRLSSSTLGDLLGALHRDGVTGLLELSEIRGPRGLSVPGRIHRIHLRGGLVIAVDTPLAVPRVGEILRRDGLASADVMRRLGLAIQAGDRRAAGEILAAEGLLAVEAVRVALTTQLRERLDALFELEDASIAFRTARPLPGVRVAPLGPRDFLFGRPRARDRAHEETPPPRSGVRPVAPAADDPRSRALRMLGVDGEAAVSEVRRAFRRLAGALHPDRAAGSSADEQRHISARFAELSAAYHLLVA